MTLISSEGISGITSFTSSGDGLDFSSRSLTGLSGVNVSGAMSATSFSGDGSSLVGVGSTDNIRTNTNATFLQNMNIVGGGITVGNTTINSHSVGFGTTTTTGRDAGINTTTGTLIYNVDTTQMEVFDGTQWVGGLTTPFSATGGTEDTTSRSGYKIHTFTSPGSFVVSGAPNTGGEYLVVAGGASGGSLGGGGAGGYRVSTSFTFNPGTYTIQVGGGGAAKNTDPDFGGTGEDGTPSFITHPGISSITSSGGGGGLQDGMKILLMMEDQVVLAVEVLRQSHLDLMEMVGQEIQVVIVQQKVVMVEMEIMHQDLVD